MSSCSSGGLEIFLIYIIHKAVDSRGAGCSFPMCHLVALQLGEAKVGTERRGNTGGKCMEIKIKDINEA